MAAVLAGLSNTYSTALGHVAGVLAVKVGVLNLMTVRSRLITGDMSSGKEGGVNQPADLAMSPMSVTFFKTMLGAVGPTFSTQKLVQLVNNAKENEPFFMGIATAIAVAGNPPTWGASALYLYCGARLGHAALFLYDFPESILPYQVLVRATPYLVGVFTMFRLAASRFS